jgi:hypothetical protein
MNIDSSDQSAVGSANRPTRSHPAVIATRSARPALIGLILLVCAGLHGLGQTPNKSSVVGTWEGSYWNTDRNHRPQEGPFLFRVTFAEDETFELSGGLPKGSGGDPKHGTWSYKDPTY